MSHTVGAPRRIASYFRVMFPLHVNVPAAAFMFYGFYIMAQLMASDEVRVGVDSLFGFATVVLSLLLFRLIDELKDEDVDAQLFPERPLVTGAVRYSDVRVLALGTILALLALNVGRGVATDVYFVYFVLFVLSWQWWLFPQEVAPRVGLVFLTHQPLVPLLFAYVYAVYLRTTGAPFDPIRFRPHSCVGPTGFHCSSGRSRARSALPTRRRSTSRTPSGGESDASPSFS
jgi:hypothetical protein